VIPLPVEVRQLQEALPSRAQARQALQLPAEAAVLLWLGRLSLLTKLDPWPAYALLQRLASRLGRALVLIECGPDDSPQQADHFEQLRRLCPQVHFLRLGGEQPVEEASKRQALAAADLGLFLVDNPQETFGLALVEAMAAGLPCVASNWDGYRDLLRPGVDGVLVNSCWAAGAEAVSGVLGWQQFTGLSTFPHTAGALAQLVQLDLRAAEAAVEGLLADANLRRAMGQAARQRALHLFDAPVVLGHYQQLFTELQARRAAAAAEAHAPQPLPLALDPRRLFDGFANRPPQAAAMASTPAPPEAVVAFRQSLWQQVLTAAGEDQRPALLAQLRAKHHQP
jgi:glycosyltransferase involved in cell wall biosynthesis